MKLKYINQLTDDELNEICIEDYDNYQGVLNA